MGPIIHIIIISNKMRDNIIDVLNSPLRVFLTGTCAPAKTSLLKKPQQEGLSTVGDARAGFCHFGYMAEPPYYPYVGRGRLVGWWVGGLVGWAGGSKPKNRFP